MEQLQLIIWHIQITETAVSTHTPKPKLAGTYKQSKIEMANQEIYTYRHTQRTKEKHKPKQKKRAHLL